MFIIQDLAGTLPMYHQLGNVIIGDTEVSISVTTTSALPMVGPGGVLQPFVGGGNYTVPEGVIHPDHISKQAVADWMVSAVGPYPGGLICDDKDFEWQSSRMALLAKARIKRDKVRSGICPVEINGETIGFETDSESRDFINGAALMAFMAQASGQPFTKTWTTADNSRIELDAEQMIAVGIAVANRIDAAQQRKNELDDLIQTITAETSQEAIDAIEAQIDEGWPA